MFWSITDEDILTAQAGNEESLRRVFGQIVPACILIASSVSGRKDVADRSTAELVNRATQQIENWRSADEASRWFMHQTIQLTRHYRKPSVDQDTLLTGVGGPDVVQYVAMINALRKLPEQQQEAFVLTYAQKWHPRICAVAMDCSVTAVETHLSEANRQLQPLLGNNFNVLMGFLHQVHKSQPIDYVPRPSLIATRLKARRGFRSLVNLCGWVLVILLLSAIAGFFLVIWPRIEI